VPKLQDFAQDGSIAKLLRHVWALAMESPAKFVPGFMECNMSSINGIGSNLPITPTTAIKGVTPSAATAASQRTSATDRLELSGASHLLTALKTNDIRTDKVANIKAQIDAGTYEDDYKLDVASDRMLDEIGK